MVDSSSVSQAFACFLKEAPKQASTWMETVKKLGGVSALDEKMQSIAYLSVLAALRLEGGIPFHVKHAKSLGVTREEIISAILLGLPAAGTQVIQVLPVALCAYDAN